MLAICLQAQTGIDKTSLITNPNFENGNSGWITESLQTQGNDAFSQKAGNTYMEKWVSSGNSVGNAKAYQKITGLPAGKYQLTAGAQNLDQNNTSRNCTGASIYAGDAKTTVYTPADYTVSFVCISGEAEIGFEAINASGNWIAFDNFRLSLMEEYGAEQMLPFLKEKLTEIEKEYDETKNGAEEFKAALDKARLLANNNEATSTEIMNEMAALEQSAFAFKVANGTTPSGTAPEVTSTNHFVATGATEALVRANTKGSNILERGVCWSTERNPTVLNERTTKSFSLNGTIFHIKGLQPATVYYVRPYVMNKTYQVAYGDEVKIVTHPKGTCTSSWNEGAPDAAANTRCREAIKQTIDYFNEWTGIQGFHLSGNYGAGTPTADCSYGGWMRIGPNAAYQAIGTVLHETGHGVGVGTSSRWWDTNVHDWKWFGREANNVYHFLENKYNDEEYVLVGDGTHGWGQKATYDWFVNGADKDTHQELQYIGGMCLLYGLFIDGLCPTASDPNGISGYTYNFDDAKKYYIMCKDSEHGLGEGLLFQKDSRTAGWKPFLTGAVVEDDAAWYMEFDAQESRYFFKNASTGYYLTHPTTGNLSVKSIRTSPGVTEQFQLMPDRTDVTIELAGKSLKTHGFWFTWYADGNKSMTAADYSSRREIGSITQTNFDYTDAATIQQWIILSEDELADYQAQAIATGVKDLSSQSTTESKDVKGIYAPNGTQLQSVQKGVNIVKYGDGQAKKLYVK